jgi:hypothetical protein
MIEQTPCAAGKPAIGRLAAPLMVTADVEASTTFYTELLAGREVGGSHSLPALVPMGGDSTRWRSYVVVAELERSLEQVHALGGAIEELGGRSDPRAVVRDPTGAEFGLLEAGARAPIPGAGDVPCWSDLVTSNAGVASAFYHQLFGWSFARMSGVHAGYVLILAAGRAIGGMRPLAERWGSEAHWLAYLPVDQCDDALIRAQELGASVAVPPIDIPEGRFVVIDDPLGARVALVSGRARE